MIQQRGEADQMAAQETVQQYFPIGKWDDHPLRSEINNLADSYLAVLDAVRDLAEALELTRACENTFCFGCKDKINDALHTHAATVAAARRK